jgi:simple sugar transport system permease protein
MTDSSGGIGSDDWGDSGPDPDDYSHTNWMARTTGVGTSIAKSLLLPTLAVGLALLVGAVIIMLTDVDAWTRFGSEPIAAIGDMLTGVWDAYKALFIGAFGSVRAISETLFTASPLILAGLAVAIGFQAGLFNIGVRGQMIMGGLAALWVGIHLSLPMILHIPLAFLAAIIGGGIWGGIAGLLKAKTGAHEVITTIMLNFIAAFFALYILKTSVFQVEGSNLPLSAPVRESARLPQIFGSQYRVSIALIIAVAAVFLMQWLLYRTTIGFEFRSAGANPSASRYAGMSVAFLITLVMAISGALGGVAGGTMTIGLAPYQATADFAGVIGFDAIALALLGRSNPFGVLWSGLLFGALIAGGRNMQGAAGVPVDLVIIMQSLIIVFIAAPMLVRAVFRMKKTDVETTQVTQGWGA